MADPTEPEASAEPGAEELIASLKAVAAEMASLRSTMSDLATERRRLAEAAVASIGPSATAQRLGISRQTLWQVLKPAQAKEIKRRSARRAPSAPAPDPAARTQR